MRRFAPCWSGLALALAAALAASAQTPTKLPDRRPLGRELPVFTASTDPAKGSVPAAPDPLGVLGLPDALAASLLGSPDLAAHAYELRAREAAVLQAGRRANPILSTEVEDVLGSGEFRGASESQTTLLLGQLVELGGKRAARVRLAAAEHELAGWDYEARRITVFTGTVDAFVEVLAAQERRRLAGEALDLAEAMRRVARRRVEAGLASPAEEIRAGVAVDAAGVEREHAEHELATARTELAAQWGGTARFERAEGDLAALPEPPPLAELQRRAAVSPDLARWAAERESRDAALASARSGRVPDVTIAAGPRHLAGPGDTALVFSASVPIPLWNRNEGAIAEARFREAKAALEQRAAEVRVATEVATALTALHASAEEAALLRARVLPGIERAVAVLQRGYEEGRHTQLEVLDGIRARIAAREQYLRALVEAHHAARQLERLTGASLEEEKP
jgi:cobalt-zinc-cadmium efflux system outer membrane protein